jgi:Oxidoreductase family, C-terminal alpha/beta domain
LRLLLGSEASPETLIALTSQVQEHLPPLDTVHAVIKTKPGTIGSFSISVGTTLSGREFSIACENGSVTASDTKVTVVRGTGANKEEHVKLFPGTSGVKEEVKAWAESLAAGRLDPLQSPELALGDLELLEKIFKSGDENGAPQRLNFQ